MSSEPEGYQALDAAMEALNGCLHSYTGQQAQAVARLLGEWHRKWVAESESHGRALDRIAELDAAHAALEAELEDERGMREYAQAERHDVAVKLATVLAENAGLRLLLRRSPAWSEALSAADIDLWGKDVRAFLAGKAVGE